VIEHAFTVAIVAAGRGGYREYHRYGAYVCQAGRTFRNHPRHFAFYADSEVKPKIAAVLARRDQLLLTPETAKQLRQQNDARLADAVAQIARDGARPAEQAHQLYLLSPPGNQRTITLEQPITPPLFRPRQRLRSRPPLHHTRRAQTPTTQHNGTAPPRTRKLTHRQQPHAATSVRTHRRRVLAERRHAPSL